MHVLAGDGVAVAPRAVIEGPQFGGDGQAHALTVAGHSGVERRRCEWLLMLLHAFIFGFCSLFDLTPLF